MKIGLDSSVLIASTKKEGENFHDACVELSRLVKGNTTHEVISSSLVLIEFRGGMASSTSADEHVIRKRESEVRDNFDLKVMRFEDYVDKFHELVIAFRELKRRINIPSTDFYHLATCIQEGCDIFVTTDFKHLLTQETRKALQQYIRIVDPTEAVAELKGGG